MWKLLLPLSLMMMGSGFISKRVENATIAAIIHQAKPFFTTDMQEIESLIRELEEKESRDSFEEVLLKEIKIYRYQLEDRLNLARRTSQADG